MYNYKFLVKFYGYDVVGYNKFIDIANCFEFYKGEK